jgi:Arc/MetJ-type ribon-helix-helix transcriptional regulator
MTSGKERVTVTLDRTLVRAGSEAVASGKAESFSGWINAALAERVAKERRLHALAQALRAYEKNHGEITEAEMMAQQRADRERAIVIRGRRRKTRKKGTAA